MFPPNHLQCLPTAPSGRGTPLAKSEGDPTPRQRVFRSLFGTDTKTHMLRGGLEEQMAVQRGIARRISTAQQASTQDAFAAELAGAQKRQQPQVDLQAEMAALADTQIRYEASAKMLRGAYDSLRGVIKNNG